MPASVVERSKHNAKTKILIVLTSDPSVPFFAFKAEKEVHRKEEFFPVNVSSGRFRIYCSSERIL